MDDAEFSLELLAGSDAFGDGGHPSTRLALQALYALAAWRDFSQVLDVGCGAGLLSMTAAHLWPQARVVAADISAQAVKIAYQNILHNRLESRIETVRSDGLRHSDISAAAPYDLIVVNIIADVAVRLAREVQQAASGDTVLVLSGILRWRSEEVLALYSQLGFTPLLPTLASGEWDTHILIQQQADI